ncbi:MAG TPA: hypothetical protein VLJ80_01355 [Solirubrobacteraceae bacterium]|nr:hypothetical protein [Solirubrobacteraceae bacterium]
MNPVTRTDRLVGVAAVGVALVLALLTGPASIAAAPGKISATLAPDGSGQLIANTEGGPAGVTWTWQACAEDGNGCSAFGNGQSSGTAGAKAGTVFEATASNSATAKSPVWDGTVAAVSPPSVSGALRANSLVTPRLAAWTGGWIGDFDRTQLAACKGVAGTDCTTLTNPDYPQGCPKGAAVIDPAFAGRYLRVADEREGVDAVFPASAISSPYGGGVWSAGPTTAVAVVGRIASATGPRATRCGPPPLGPTGTLSRRGIATVNCPAACKISLHARHGSRQIRLTRRLAKAGTLNIALGHMASKRLGAGPLILAVYVNGSRVTSRIIHARF